MSGKVKVTCDAKFYTEELPGVVRQFAIEELIRVNAGFVKDLNPRIDEFNAKYDEEFGTDSFDERHYNEWFADKATKILNSKDRSRWMWFEVNPENLTLIGHVKGFKNRVYYEVGEYA